tara:strand:+ start:36 stop:2165 length:2130 start_codon:yes stop_codon:yes gene_type:complete
MRVVIAHNRYRSENPSGENRVVESDIEQLRADGVEVYPYIRDSDEITNWTAAGKAGLAVRPLVSPADAIAFRQMLRRVRPDIVHLHNPFPIISPWIVRTAKAERIPVVQTVHNYRHVCVNGIHFRDGNPCTECVGKTFPWPAVQHGCYQGSRARSLPMAAAVTAHRGTWDLVDRFLPVGEAVADHLRALGIADNRIEVRPNVVDDPGEPAPLGEGVLFVGRLSEEKGVRALLEAWRTINLDDRHSLSIAGDGELRHEVEAAASSDPSLRYLGLLSKAKLDDAYRRCAIVVGPSLCHESDGISIVAALSHGRPAITTNIGAPPTIVGEDAGWIVAPDSAGLAGGLRAALSDRAELEQRSMRARSKYLAERAPKSGLGLSRVYQGLIRIPDSPLAILDLAATGSVDLAEVRPNLGSNPTCNSWVRPLGFPRRVGMHTTALPFAVASTQIYQPQKSRAKAAKRVGVALARVGLARQADSQLVDLERILKDADLEADGLSVLRSSRDGRSIVGGQRGGHMSWVAKIGPIGDHSLRNESIFLTMMAGFEGAWKTPNMIYYGKHAEQNVIATEAVSHPQRAITLGLDDAIRIATDLFLGEGQRPPIVHGDLTPWNCIYDSGVATLLDWETASLDPTPMWDICHFVIQRGILLGSYSPRTALRLLSINNPRIAEYLRSIKCKTDPRFLIDEYIQTTQRATFKSSRYLGRMQRLLHV